MGSTLSCLQKKGECIYYLGFTHKVLKFSKFHVFCMQRALVNSFWDGVCIKATQRGLYKSYSTHEA